MNNDNADPGADAFEVYLVYLYSYWKIPEYSQFLIYPGVTLHAIWLLQGDTF
ncbi:hypothetical protein BDW59DRAFT_146100 [Aspergillus cavernicola]|uniref:Mediator of RNA polymerase II transcription subunit 31 n=1 Tax=Aspergillus cavernicola TaxID=176166 RepID=A0ABR4ID12_9EURO